MSTELPESAVPPPTGSSESSTAPIRRTHDERLRLLREEGVTDAQLTRLRSPIGLDLGARTPEETAVSITAEIIAHTNQGTGLPLTRITGPIHRPAGQSRPALAR